MFLGARIVLELGYLFGEAIIEIPQLWVTTGSKYTERRHHWMIEAMSQAAMCFRHKPHSEGNFLVPDPKP